MGFFMKPAYLSQEDWDSIPKFAQKIIAKQEETISLLVEQNKRFAAIIEKLEARIEELEARLSKNSGNSNKPPSSDGPFKKANKPDNSGRSAKKRGAKKGHKGHRQVMLDPSAVIDMKPVLCQCGSHNLAPCPEQPFYVHQVIELPDIQMDITHFRLFKTSCRNCGRTVKGRIPKEHRTGYGPRFSALVSQLSGICGESRETVRDFAASVLGVPISMGGVQRIIDRASAATLQIYEAIADEARNAPVNHVDETSWKTESRRKWLWVMANRKVAFFMIHKNRSYEAFCQLVDAWEGILVSDDYALYRKWVHERQSCLAHHLRRARGLAERKNPDLAHFGKRLVVELSLIVQWAYETPTMGEWRAFNARFKHLVRKHHKRKDESGVFARRLINEMESLWLCLSEKAVEPTNNQAERALRYPVTWRKRSLGTQSEKGDRWVERILSLKQTCRMHGIATYPRLVQAISDYLKEQPTDLAWIVNLG